MKREIQIFLTTLSFYTCIPLGGIHKYKPEYLSPSLRYLPLVGWITGTISAVVFHLCSQVFGPSISIAMAMLAGILITGAFHEDGFADVCDGFGGGWSKEKILEIMKDSRLGTYGVTGLVMILGLKFLALQELLALGFKMPFQQVLLFTLGASISRSFAASFIFSHSYVGNTELSKTTGAVERGSILNLALAFLFGLIPLLALSLTSAKPSLLLIIIPLCLSTALPGRYFNKWIGGYTGDCLGAVQQINELVSFLSLIILWKFT